MNLHIAKNRLIKGRVTMPFGASDRALDNETQEVGEELRKLIHARFGRSFHIRQVDSGSCGACESEIIACLSPIYDIQRFGIDFVASPRHADALLVTGPVSRNMARALKKTYDAMPGPKFVISMGECAAGGGAFAGSYYTCSGVQNILPVTFHIPGCPLTPQQIILSLCAFLQNV